MGRSDRPNSTSISAVHRKISGYGSLGRSDHEQCTMNLSRSFLIGRMFVVLEFLILLDRAREPSISRSAAHLRRLVRARGIQTSRAGCNQGRWIQDQRSTFADPERACARSPASLGPSDPGSTAHNRPRRYGFIVFPRDYFAN